MSHTTRSVLVAMPFFNASPYLRDALASILNQTYSRFQAAGGG